MFFKKLGFILSLTLLITFYSDGEIMANEAPILSEVNQYDSYAVKPYTLTIDEEKYMVNFFINPLGRTMISTTDLARLFPCSVEWADSSQVIVVKGGASYGFTLNEPTYFTPTQIYNMDTAPIGINDDIYIPLRYIIQEFGYAITFCPEHEQYFLNSNPADTEEPLCENPLPAAEIGLPENLPRWGSLNEIESLAPLYNGQDLMAGFYTTLLDRSDSRTNNVDLAAKAIDNIILAPGEVFSFNQAVGRRTVDKGYLEAPIFVGEKVETGIGGGICQVSSTLYNTALLANLPVLERHPHSLTVAYVPTDQDATVVWGITDFRFKNTLDHPIKIMTKVINNYVVTGIFRE